MDEPARELAFLRAGRDLAGAHEMAVGVPVAPAPQMGLAVVERALKGRPRRRPRRLVYAPLSHENPAGLAGGSSGLRGSPSTGSGAL